MKWSKEEVDKLLRMKRDGRDKFEIAKALDRSPKSVGSKIDDIKLFGEPSEVATRHSIMRSSVEADVSHDMLRERDRMMLTDTRSEAEKFLGSPPYYRSALFKKNGQTA